MLSLLGAFGGFVILWFSGFDIIKGSFTIGSYLAFSAYVGKLFGPTQIFASIGLSFQPAKVALNRILEIMDLSGEDENGNGIEINSIKKEIGFENVFFSYNTKPVLADVSFKIKRGEKIVLAGANGSGKSTIIKLILRLYKAQNGAIFIDDFNINDVSVSSLRERISIVSQNTFLFSDTIKNNILYSRPEAKETEIEEAAKLSGASEFIETLEKGFETEIGERGTRLSGGERQKISIARAILKDSDVIIFDEATTHLDNESEKRINTLIRDKFQSKTCIIISHKILDIPEINKIYFIKQGKIEEQEKGQ
jgi:subfamily B ATP-binding cassette protein MsbA